MEGCVLPVLAECAITTGVTNCEASNVNPGVALARRTVMRPVSPGASHIVAFFTLGSVSEGFVNSLISVMSVGSLMLVMICRLCSTPRSQLRATGVS